MMKRIVCVAATSVSFFLVKAQVVDSVNTGTAQVENNSVSMSANRFNDSIILNWSLPPGDIRKNIKSLVLYKSLKAALDFTSSNEVVAIINSADSSYVDVDVQNGTAYYYALVAIDHFHNQTPLSTISVEAAGSVIKEHVVLKARLVEDQQINLSWTIDQPGTTSYFDLEKSINGSDFTVITKMSAGRQQHFESTDIAGVAGTVYYRIKSVEQKGKATYSSTEVVKLLSAANLVKVYPNVLLRGDLLTIKSISENKGRMDYTLMNSSAKVVAKGTLLSLTGARVLNETRMLSNGRYVLQVVQGNQHQVIQILVQ
jgi:hypothetical protein